MVDAFEQAVRGWRDAPFPVGSSVDALDELHADLALYDGWVAESVIPFVERGIRVPAKVDVLGSLDAFLRRAEEFEGRAGVEERGVAEAYVAYARQLGAVYAGFLEAGNPC